MALGQSTTRHRNRGFASGGVTVSTSGATAPSSSIAANSSVAPFTGNAYETLPPATSIPSIAQTSRPYSNPIANVPTSALSGGAGSNGVIAAVNSQGIPQGSPSAPNVIPNASFAPPVPAVAPMSSATPSPIGAGPNGSFTYNGQRLFDGQGNPITTSPSPGQTYFILPTSGPSQGALYPLTIPGSSRGGKIKGFAGGGVPTSEAMDPFYARAEERQGFMAHPEGLFGSTGAGRTDVHNMNVSSGSYIMPADVVSGLGEGSSLAGSAIIDRMMRTNPYGIEGGGGRRASMGPPRVVPQRVQSSGDSSLENRGGQIKRASGGSTDPKPKEKPMYLDLKSMPMPSVNKIVSVLPSAVSSTLPLSQKVQPQLQQDDQASNGSPMYGGYAKGGSPKTNNSLVPIVVAGGEYLVWPQTIIKKFGSLKRGHQILDKFVVSVRKKTVKEMSKLPSPKK